MSLLKWVPFNSTKYRTDTPHERGTAALYSERCIPPYIAAALDIYSMVVDDAEANQHCQVTSLYLSQAIVYLATAN